MINVSTKTGDKGKSGLANGVRISKGELIFEVLGTVDELNSWLGLCVIKITPRAERVFLLSIQDTLFHLGAELASSHKAKLQRGHLKKLETHSTKLQATMEENWTSKFLLPGGTETAAYLDITRTVCRKLERLVVRLSEKQSVSPLILSYINRLSDYLYVLRCKVNLDKRYEEKPFKV